MIKKIKDKLQHKPRLYKVLKIVFKAIEYSLVILGFIFFVGMITYCSVGAETIDSYYNRRYEAHDDNAIIYDINDGKPINKAFAFTQYDYYGTAELGTPHAIENYIYYMSLLGVDCYSVSSLYVHNFTLNGNAFFRSTFDVTGDPTAGRIFTCQNIQFRIDPVTRTDINNSYQWYCLDFIDTTNADHYYRYNFCRVENKKLGGTNIWISEGMYQGYYSVPSHAELLHLQNMVFCISNQGVDGIDGWSRLFFPFYMDETTNGFNNGYHMGKQTGYSLGYDDGYTIGYEDGVGSQVGIVNNPFDLIANAFGAIASILDIRVLPGLSLGVLIFTPLVVTIIIVVIKMIKG